MSWRDEFTPYELRRIDADVLMSRMGKLLDAADGTSRLTDQKQAYTADGKRPSAVEINYQSGRFPSNDGRVDYLDE